MVEPIIYNHSIGVPLPPNPQFSIVNESSVQIRWEAPFTWQDYPIVNYTVEVTSQAIAELLTSVVLGPDSLSYTLTQMKYSNSCTNLTFSLHATSEVGTSLPGITYGAFPAGIEPHAEWIIRIQIYSFLLHSCCCYYIKI